MKYSYVSKLILTSLVLVCSVDSARAQQSATPSTAASQPTATAPTNATYAPDATNTSASPQSVPQAAITGTGTANYLPLWTSGSNLGVSKIYQANGGFIGINTNTPLLQLDVNGNSIFRGSFQMAPQGVATAGAGQPSHSFQWQASLYDSSKKAAVNEAFGFRTVPATNNVANPAAKLDLFYGPGGGTLTDTTLSINSFGIITFAPGQTFPGGGGGGGTITGVTAGTGLTGGGTSGNVTLKVAVPLVLSASAADGVIQGNDTGSGFGLSGTSASGSGVSATSPNGIGVSATGASFGVLAQSGGNIGVYGSGPYAGVSSYGGSYGILTTAYNTSGTADGVHTTGGNGVYATSNLPGGNGVYALSENGSTSDYAIWGVSNTGWAGVFSGNVSVSGTLTKAAGTFKIDDPLDPANKYLSHSFVESPDMMNIYNGIAELDNSGGAIVQMPAYFSALNKEFRYQLTPIGAPGPNLYIAEEIQANRFMIAGGKPGMRVSWQVTGVRQDAYANAHRTPVEQDKPEIERGTYLHPELFDQPEEKSLEYALHPDEMKRRPKQVVPGASR